MSVYTVIFIETNLKSKPYPIQQYKNSFYYTCISKLFKFLWVRTISGWYKNKIGKAFHLMAPLKFIES